jgi:hypothetical protein
MKTNNPFDKKLKITNDIPDEIRGALTQTAGTLELSWDMAQAIFEERATPEIAIAIYDLVLETKARNGRE